MPLPRRHCVCHRGWSHCRRLGVFGIWFPGWRSAVRGDGSCLDGTAVFVQVDRAWGGWSRRRVSFQTSRCNGYSTNSNSIKSVTLIERCNGARVIIKKLRSRTRLPPCHHLNKALAKLIIIRILPLQLFSRYEPQIPMFTGNRTLESPP